MRVKREEFYKTIEKEGRKLRILPQVKHAFFSILRQELGGGDLKGMGDIAIQRAINSQTMIRMYMLLRGYILR